MFSFQRIGINGFYLLNTNRLAAAACTSNVTSVAQNDDNCVTELLRVFRGPIS